jgi:hypothetical protein
LLRAMPVWAVWAALATALLGLPSFVPAAAAAPSPTAASAQEQRVSASMEGSEAHGDVHHPAEDCHSFPIRPRQQTIDRLPCAHARGAENGVCCTVVMALPASLSSPVCDNRRQPRPAKGLTPATLQVLRC